MNMTQKYAASIAAVAVVSVVLFTSASASMKQLPSTPVAGAQSTSVIVPLNSPETPASQLNDLQY